MIEFTIESASGGGTFRSLQPDDAGTLYVEAVLVDNEGQIIALVMPQSVAEQLARGIYDDIEGALNE